MRQPKWTLRPHRAEATAAFEAPTVTLRQAAEILGIREAVLMRAFLEPPASRRDVGRALPVRREALNGANGEAHRRAECDGAQLTATMDAWAAELVDTARWCSAFLVSHRSTPLSVGHTRQPTPSPRAGLKGSPDASRA